MATFVYKAFDSHGHKKAGRLRVFSAQDAHLELRSRGLKAYFLADLSEIRRKAQRRKRRRFLLMSGGGALIAIALVATGLVIGIAGRPSADVVGYRESGILRGGAGTVVAETREEKEFAAQIYDAWLQFAPDTLEGIEVRKGFMTVYVTRKARRLPSGDLEHLATSTVRALQRQLGRSAGTLLIVEGNVTLMEVRYNGLTKAMHIREYS